MCIYVYIYICKVSLVVHCGVYFFSTFELNLTYLYSCARTELALQPVCHV